MENRQLSRFLFQLPNPLSQKLPLLFLLGQRHSFLPVPEPIPKYGETRCYIRDPDGYIIEVG
jgi:catechol 2,3-dioxygenase-like lactoylglutathione lyase family enzyme